MTQEAQKHGVEWQVNYMYIEINQMSVEQRAKQFKRAILKNGGTYDIISQITGISSRTLKRIASGETDPRFSDVIKISEATGVDLYQFVCADIGINKYVIKDPHIGTTILSLSRLVDLTSAMLIGNQQRVEHELNKVTRSLSKEEIQEQAPILLSNVQKDIEDKLRKSEEMVRNVEAMREVMMNMYDQDQLEFESHKRMLDGFKSEGRITNEEYQKRIDELENKNQAKKG